MKQAESRITFSSDQICEQELVLFMHSVFVELSKTLGDVTDRISILANCAKTTILPAYLQPGQVLLGKFYIQNVLSFREIFDQDLLSKGSSVF